MMKYTIPYSYNLQIYLLHYMGLEKKFEPKFSKCTRASKYLSIKLPLLSTGKGPTPTEAPLHPLNTEVEL